MIKFIKNKKVEIYINERVVEASKMAVLLIHGLAEHSGRYVDFIKKLTEANISVFAMDLRGHGQSKGKKGDSENINKVIEDVDLVVEYIKSNYNFENFGIFGHSIGGMVSSLYASLNAGKVDFMILSSPAIYCPKKLKIMKFVPYKLLPFVYVKKKHSESQEMLDYSRKDRFALHKFSIRTVGVFFIEGLKKLNKVLNIKCPVLLLNGQKDRLLSEQYHFEEFMSKLDNKKNEIISYKDAKHRIVQNEGADKRIKDIINWIKKV